MYEPTDTALRRIYERISSKSWRRRVRKARALERKVLAVWRRVEKGQKQNSAIRGVVEPSQRSRMIRALLRYKDEGVEGLIDRRTPREPKVPKAQRDLICAARRTQPHIRVSEIKTLVEETTGGTPSETTIKRILKEAGLTRREGRPAEAAGEVEVEELGTAGFELLKAAEAETGAVSDIVEAVQTVGHAIPPPEPVSEEERRLRNDKGQLTAQYNRARRKSPGELVAPAYRTAFDKATERDLGRVAIRTEPEEIIERKTWALMSLPVLTRGTRIDELYGPMGQLLEGICGYPYMPETLRKTVSEWTVVGLGPVLQQTVGDTWHRVSSERWEQGYRAGVVYVDNTVKPLWTGKFTLSTKVSSTGRVQPALVSTFINSGAGTPIHFETYSGSAPLAPRVLALLERVDQQSEQPVGRLTVIDGECCSAALLVAFKAADRDLVTPLASSMALAERIRFGPGSAPRAYRDGDTLREGEITLTSSADKSLQVTARAIVIERRTKETWTVLVTLAERELWSARVLADLYFSRWPMQEGFFREANGALGLGRVHGYGKQVVTNTSVVTKLEDVRSRIGRLDQEVTAHEGERLELVEALAEASKAENAAGRYTEKRNERIDVAVASGRTHTLSFERAAIELREGGERLAEAHEQVEKQTAKLEKVASRYERKSRKLAELKEKEAKLEPRQEILEADVAQDTLLAALKLTLGMLVHFVVREYFPHRPMEWRTFLSRIALLPGRRETTDEKITIYIQANTRDRDMMEALDKACQRINTRKLERDGKQLRFVLERPDDESGWLN